MIVLFESMVISMDGILTGIHLRAFEFEIYLHFNQVRTVEDPIALLGYSLSRYLAPGQIPYSFMP